MNEGRANRHPVGDGRVDGGIDPLSGPLMLVFAHPDDETFGCAGVVAAATERGIPVTLLSATRGEAGKTGIPQPDSPPILGAVREQELRAAATVLGVTDVRFLDYRDSGMAGTPENDDPRAFIRADAAEVVARLVVQLRAARPGTVLTFGPEGIYGHPDHLMIHRTTVAALAAAGDPAYRPELGEPWRATALYFSAVPRERLLRLVDRPDGPLRDLSREEREKIGTPADQITTVVDIARFAERKERALAAHRTQVGDGGPLAGMPAEQREATLAREHFVRHPLPWDEDPARLPTDVVAALAAASPVAPA